MEVKKIIIKKVLKLPESELKNLVLVNFDGKKLSKQDMFKPMKALNSNMAWDRDPPVVLQYGMMSKFRQVVFAFKSTGEMSEAFFNQLQESNGNKLRSLQTNSTLKTASDSVLLTFVALNVLNTQFASDKNLWKLV